MPENEQNFDAVFYKNCFRNVTKKNKTCAVINKTKTKQQKNEIKVLIPQSAYTISKKEL